jgi:cytoskeletal protein CcmA (bactofilin family)
MTQPAGRMTTIGASLVITGELIGDEDVTIGGEVRGPITLRTGTLIVSESARLTGEIRASRIVVHGNVDGTVSATERIELGPSATVSGSLSANHVVIADGATFNGRIDMDQRTITAKVAQYRAAQPGR